MDPSKLEAMSKWPTPTKKKEVQAFLGFANYYRRFILNYSSKARPLTELTKDITFSWGEAQQTVFDELRQCFLSAPILTQFDRTLESIVETDASNQAISGILSQYHVLNSIKKVYPVEYHAKTFMATQRNWPIHDKELFAIVDSFRKWRDWLVGVQVNLYTDHQGLQYFNTKQKLNSRQASWYLRMSELFYNIHYRPVTKMGKADGLSRRSGEEKSSMEMKFFEDGQLLVDEEDVEVEAEDIDLQGIDISGWEKKNRLWVVPEVHKLDVLWQHYDSQVAGHWGRHRTQELVSRNFIWEGWQEDVAKYVAGCIRCQKAKADRHSRQTKLVPMPTGERPFEEIAMDFVGELPESEGFNTILVVTDRFTKVQHYLPTKTTWTAADVAATYINEIWRLYGLPRHIISDRGPQFVSKFLKQLNNCLGIQLRLSTAYHLQTDGLSEHAVQTLKQYLRIYCHDRQKRWRAWLPLAEFAYNTSATSTHKYSPYRSLYSFDPRTIHLSDNYTFSSPTAEEWLDRMTTVHNQIHNTLKQINNKRSAINIEKARWFAVNNWVLVDHWNLQVQADNNQSLTNKWIEPYKVIEAIGSHAYRLEVPEGTRWHNVVHTTLLKPFNRRNEDQEMDDDDPDVYEVESIIDSRKIHDVVKYRVRWVGHTEFEDTWEMFNKLDNCPDRVKAFCERYPNKPQDIQEV